MEHLPLLPIGSEEIKALTAAMQVYQRYRQQKTASTEERRYTLLVLAFLIPKLTLFASQFEVGTPLFLTEDEIRVLKGGLTTLLDALNRRPQSAGIKREMQRLKKLKTAIETTFRTTQD